MPKPMSRNWSLIIMSAQPLGGQGFFSADQRPERSGWWSMDVGVVALRSGAPEDVFGMPAVG